MYVEGRSSFTATLALHHHGICIYTGAQCAPTVTFNCGAGALFTLCRCFRKLKKLHVRSLDLLTALEASAPTKITIRNVDVLPPATCAV